MFTFMPGKFFSVCSFMCSAMIRYCDVLSCSTAAVIVSEKPLPCPAALSSCLASVMSCAVGERTPCIGASCSCGIASL